MLLQEVGSGFLKHRPGRAVGRSRKPQLKMLALANIAVPAHFLVCVTVPELCPVFDSPK